MPTSLGHGSRLVFSAFSSSIWEAGENKLLLASEQCLSLLPLLLLAHFLKSRSEFGFLFLTILIQKKAMNK